LLRYKNLFFVFAATFLTASIASAAGHSRHFAKLDAELNHRAASAPGSQTTSVIVRVTGDLLPIEFRKYARPGTLPIVNGYVLDVPNSELKTIAQHASTIFANHNATVHAFNFRTAVQSGAFFARRMLGYTGAGVGVAVLDSGIAPVDDFAVQKHGQSRVYFQDFLDPAYDGAPKCALPCDPNGHGTHVAGTIAGSGFDSFGERAGMAPDASLYALRVLGKNGSGPLSGVLEALDWVLKNARAHNIRVVNLSFGMAPQGELPDANPLETMLDPKSGDPLAIATKALVDAGIFVVAAAGNLGQIDCTEVPHPNPDPVTHKCDVWGGVTAPGTYPWVFTAGASSSIGTFTRTDDTRAKFSSRGPAFPLQNAKPDLLAGGVGIESTSAPGSTLYTEASQRHPDFLIDGAFPTAEFPYIALTGTSQASAVVSGVAAQMLQANPTLTPNLMKAVLEYTSQEYSGNKPLEQGAGFLNALGAVRLARFYATAREGQHVPVEPIWSQHFIWGNHVMSRGFMLPNANAWTPGVMWGTPNVNGETGDNIVWGTVCAQGDCGDNIVWGTSRGDTIVWGTADGDNIDWGTSGDGDNIVWGTADGDNIVWGTDDGDNIVWGTDDGDNIVWGTADGDNIVWGTADGDNIVWGTSGSLDTVWVSSPDGTQTPLGGSQVFDKLTDKTLLKLLEYAPPPAAQTNAPPPSAPPATDVPSAPPATDTPPVPPVTIAGGL